MGQYPSVSPLLCTRKKNKKGPSFLVGKGTWLTFWNCPREKGKSFFFSYGHYWIGIQSMLPEYIRATRLLLLLVLLCISFHVIFDLSYGTHTPDGQVLFLSLLHITSRRGTISSRFLFVLFFFFVSPVRYYPLYFSNKLSSNKKTKFFERLYFKAASWNSRVALSPNVS